MLLNDPSNYQLMSRYSYLQTELAKKKSIDDKIRLLFLSIYAKEPTKKEVELAYKYIIQSDNQTKGVNMLIRAMVNTQRFIFIQ